MDDQIQPSLHKVFNSNSESVQGAQGSFVTTNKRQAQEQDSFEIKPSVIAPTAASNTTARQLFSEFFIFFIEKRGFSC